MNPEVILSLLSMAGQSQAFSPATLLQGLLGASQLYLSSRYAKEKRPDWQIPPSALIELENARRMATDTTSYADMLRTMQLEKAASDYTRAKEVASTAAGLQGMVGNMSENDAEQMRKAALEQYLQNISNMAQYREALRMMAGHEGDKYKWEKINPYLAAMQTAKELQNAGIMNISGSLQTGQASQMMSNAYGDNFWTELLKSVNQSNAQTPQIPVPQTKTTYGYNDDGTSERVKKIQEELINIINK